ncbi:HTH domain-containing protein [Martelella sp. FLE1502]
MDSLITAAALALATGDPLLALNRVALRDDAPALALRGIAMAQLGDLERARTTLRAAARAFGRKQPLAHARCVVAEAEIALVSRDLAAVPAMLAEAGSALESHGDTVNARYATILEARRLLLVGRIEEAESLLGEVAPQDLLPSLRAAHQLAVSDIAMRRLRAAAARHALAQAEDAARTAGFSALIAEVQSAGLLLRRPAARVISEGAERPLRLDEIERLLVSETLVIDACRHVIRHEARVVSLATRPVLFALLRTMGEHWPRAASREALLGAAFGAKRADESHRARLRVEIARLRAELGTLANVRATQDGFAISSGTRSPVVVLAPPADSPHAALLALLADGEAWPSSSLALALGTSTRTVQRALERLQAEGKVRAVGQGRSRRWLAPPILGFPTVLLLPGAQPGR